MPKSAMRSDVLANCLQRRVVLLDGGIGSELIRRRVPGADRLWGVGALLEAPDRVRELHREYALADADLLTAATFRVAPYSLRRAGLATRTAELASLAITLVREGAASCNRRVLVMASLTTLEDCYRPELAPSDLVLEREHAATVEILVEAGADGLLLETFNTVREATVAARLAAETDLPVVVSFACHAGGRLLSGEDAAVAAEAVTLPGILAVGVNCTACADVPAALYRLRQGTPLPLAAWANNGWAAEDSLWLTAPRLSPEAFAEETLSWVASGVRMAGGCCGTGPAEIAALAARRPVRQR